MFRCLTIVILDQVHPTISNVLFQMHLTFSFLTIEAFDLHLIDQTFFIKLRLVSLR